MDGQINTREGVSSIADKATGQLLFYSEGTRVWNRSHAVMPNGSGLLGDYSSTQSSVIVPNPANPNQYYLFTTALFKGMRYSVVDMSLEGGLGDVVAATRNTQLIADVSSSEKLIAVEHCNKKDYWIITHTLFSNTFYVYAVTAAGIQAPVTYNLGYSIGNAIGWEAVGYLKLSPDGSKLAHVIGPPSGGGLSRVELFSFNNSTGVISGPPNVVNNLDFPYGVEFSQSGAFLYISEQTGKKLLQYETAAPSINATRKIIATSPNLWYDALQLAPDNKIYVSVENGNNVGYPYLGVINNPEAPGTACGYVQDAIDLNGRATLVGLPTFSATFLKKDTASINVQVQCAGNSTSFHLTNTQNIDSVKWDFGDGSDSSMLQSPGHIYATGAYTIKAYIYRSCNVNDTVTKSISIGNCAVASAGFTAPDTVCINKPVTITNTSVGASSYFWNFCVADIDKAPVANNIGNPSGRLANPVFMDYAFANGNYYGFTTNFEPGGLVRLDFGNSLLNAPTAVNLGNFGGIIPPVNGGEGLQVVQNEGKWYVIMVGGNPNVPGGVPPRILKIELGVNIANPAPTATDWGNLGNMLQPIDLHLFREGNNWYGFTVNSENNTITRFNFTNSFNNTPTALNLGNIGNLSYPTGIFAISDNGNYRVFITNGGDNSRSASGNFSLTRLDFGSTLLNIPTGVNLGNPGNVLRHPRDLTIMRSCDQVIAFAVNGAVGADEIVKFNFNNDLSSVPTGSSLGNLGNLNFPHSISRLFRVNEDIYGFVTNVSNNTITRLRFPGCANASIASSAAQTPPPVVYNAPGTYNINLTVDDGLPTQTAFCKQVVVLPAPVQQPTQEVTLCLNGTLRIGTNKKNVTYLWNTGATTDSIDVTAPGTYWVEVNSFDCKITDTIKVTVKQVSDFGFKQDMCDPLTVQFFNASAASSDPWWDMGDGTIITGNTAPSHTYAAYGDYTVRFSISDGMCADTITKIIPISVVKDDVVLTPDTIICDGTTKQLRAVQALSYCWYPATYLDNPAAQNPVTSPPQDITYYLYTEVTGSNLIVNGDFSAGNTGFTSQYNYAASNTTEGEYSVGANPRAWNGSTSNCRDHTTGGGNMLLVNGNPIAGERVWTQTVPVVPNTSYAFSTWIQSISEANPAQLQFSINGKNMAGVIAATLPGCNWLQFYTTWNSGNSTTAEISVVNINTIRDGNDFALDDISFAPVFIKQDSVVVKVEKPQVKTNKDSVVCKGQTVPLVATGAVAYSWLPATGLSDPAIANPVATVQGLTQYIVTGTTLNGCTAKDTVLVDVFAKPAISKTPDTTVCRNSHFPLYISGGVGYEWAPAGQVDDVNSDRPRVTVGTEDITFQVTITDPNGCAFGDSVEVKIFPGMVSDFAFKQDVCDPRTVQFFNTGSGANDPWWSMGDGSEVTGNTAPLHTYAADGDYEIQFSVSDGTCTDTISRIIPVRILKENIVLTPDTVICDGTTKQLRTVPALNYCWFPTTYLDDPSAQNPVTSTPQDITYYLHSEITGANLIVNGDFSAGNTGFGSDYQYIPSNYTTIGAYAVHSNPLGWNTWASACTDHTGNNGNMMLMDGAGTPGKRVWYATVAVQPNTNYLLSAWAQSVSTTNFARLRFSVNDRMAGNIYLQLSDPCQWEHFSTTWFSGSQTTATIAIEDFNYDANGNDFALDDIFFAPVFIKRDSVMVRVEKPVVRTNKDTTVCKEKPVPLMATGAAVYSWSPAIGLSGTNISNPIATPTVGQTEYIVTGTTIHGCVAKDTVRVGAFPQPVIAKTSDTSVCRNAVFPLAIAGGVSYRWSPASHLGDINSDHPVVSVGTDPVTFHVEITDQYTCISQDSVQVAIRPYPVFTATGNRTICEGGSQPLKASGGDVYQWLPANMVDDPASPTPVARPAATTPFSVYILESTCGFDTTINMRITVNPRPVLTVDKPHDVNCNTPTVQLKAAGALHYSWSPAIGLDDPTRADPVVAIDATTRYKVSGTNQYGCSDSAFVAVKVSKEGIPRFVTPNAFTPNGDGNNDCFGIKRWGDAVVEEFAVYNRWGQLMFRTNNPAQCWDGTFKGKPQDSGGYVYVIKARTICGVVSTKGVVMLIR